MMLLVNAEILFDNPSVYYQLCAETECHREIIKNGTWHNRADYSDWGESSGEVVLNTAFLFAVDVFHVL